MLLRLGSIPVRIRAPFLLMALVLGAARSERPDFIAIFVAIVFVSVIVHELGHAVVGRIFGLVPQIELHGMGGTTSWGDGRDVGNARSMAISVAGPFAGFALAALVLASRRGFHPQNEYVLKAVQYALEVNIIWGVFNLMPILPLDGGNLMRSGLHLVTKGRGEKPARVISIVTGTLLVAFAAQQKQVWLAVLGAFFTWANIQAYRQAAAPEGETAASPGRAPNQGADGPLAEAIEKAYLALERHEGAEAIALLRPVIVANASAELRANALRIYSYALLLEGKWDELLPMLERNAALIGVDEMTRYAKTARELGLTAEADKITMLIPGPRAANDFR